MKQPGHRAGDCDAAMTVLRPRTLQGNVQAFDHYANTSRYLVRLDGAQLSVILEVECVDEALWAHLSACGQRPARIPTWAELRWCKDYFLGDRRAVQVLPPRSEYVNINPNVLHLYAPLEHDPMPDFRGPSPELGGRLSI